MTLPFHFRCPAITVAFQKTSYTTNEGAGQVPICLSIVQGSVDEEKTAGVEVGLSFSAETATAGIQYSALVM